MVKFRNNLLSYCRYYSTFLKVYGEQYLFLHLHDTQSYPYSELANPDQRQRMVHIRKLVLGLPKCNRDLLMAVIKFLNLVAEHENVNKMSSLNLAVVSYISYISTGEFSFHCFSIYLFITDICS